MEKWVKMSHIKFCWEKAKCLTAIFNTMYCTLKLTSYRHALARVGLIPTVSGQMYGVFNSVIWFPCDIWVRRKRVVFHFPIYLLISRGFKTLGYDPTEG